jgi:hypothetical protein
VLKEIIRPTCTTIPLRIQAGNDVVTHRLDDACAAVHAAIYKRSRLGFGF